MIPLIQNKKGRPAAREVSYGRIVGVVFCRKFRKHPYVML